MIIKTKKFKNQFLTFVIGKYCEMLTDLQQAKQWLKQYEIQDLSRSLIRQFFIQNHLSDTLKCFENQDRKTHKKINKSSLIKILSMNNLVFLNKQHEKPLKSLLQILVSYLKDKFRIKVQLNCNESDTHTKKTEMSNLQNNYKDQYLEKIRLDKSLNNTMNLSKNKGYADKNQDKKQQFNSQNHKNESKHKNNRPVTSGGHKNKDTNKNVQLIYAQLAKQQLKELQAKKKEKQQVEMKKIKEKQQIQSRRKADQQRMKQRKAQQQKLKKEKEKTEREEKQRIEKQLQQQRQRQRKIREEEKQRQKRQQEREKQIEIEKNRRQQEKKRQIIRKQQENKMREQQINKKKQEILSNRIDNQKQQSKRQQSKTGIHQQNEGPKSSTRMTGMRKIVKKKETQNQFVLQKEESKPEQKKEESTFILPKDNEKNDVVKQKQKKQEGPKMVTIGKKKKQLGQKEDQPKKFKFDQNFVDEPLHGHIQKYEYEKIKLSKITLKTKIVGEINYKQKYTIGNKKYNEKTITQSQFQQLKKAVFQSGSSVLPKPWYQGFILSPHHATPYGLQQIEGGPCGIIAAIQCYFLKHLLHLSEPKSQQQLSNEVLRQNCLVAAITDMLMKSKSSDKIILALPPKSFSGTKIDLSNLRIVTIDASTFSQAFEGIYNHKSYFIGKSNHGVEVLIYCIVMTKGVQKIWQEIDMMENPLIGHHGHCTQQLVNLFITGYASSNCFDGTKILDSEIKLKGIENKSQFGFLTIFQTLKYIEVGKNLKNPVYPFWIICKEFHYHVIFSNHYLISENNNNPKFDIVYFDGLYNCADKIVITLESYPYGEEVEIKIKDLPLIEQVMMTKWGSRKADWNGAIKIL